MSIQETDIVALKINFCYYYFFLFGRVKTKIPTNVLFVTLIPVHMELRNVSIFINMYLFIYICKTVNMDIYRDKYERVAI